MKKPPILSTTPAAGIPALSFAAVFILLTIYTRLPWPFLFLMIYLSYLLWNYWWVWAGLRSAFWEEGNIPPHVFKGESLNYVMKVTGRWSLPLMRCGFLFKLPAALEVSGRPPLFPQKLKADNYQGFSENNLPINWCQYETIPFWSKDNKSFSLSLKIKAGRRGYYYLPPPSFAINDPAGLYQGLKKGEKERYLWVFPPLLREGVTHKASSFEEITREDIYGREDPFSAIGIKDYEPGDLPKNINWPATARAGVLKTNIFQRKDSAYCLIVFDFTCGIQPSWEMDHDFPEDAALERALSTVCETALHYLEEGFQTGFYTNAPLVYWSKRENAKKGEIEVQLGRRRKITALDFTGDERQGEKILRICARIDDRARAAIAAQKSLWSLVQRAPAEAIVYLFSYHTPPGEWLRYDWGVSEITPYNPAAFYTPRRLADLGVAQVRHINLSPGGCTP